MAGLFVDTWGWLALRDKSDRRHREVLALLNQALEQGAPIVTTDYVLDETFTLLFRRLATHLAKASMDFLMAATYDGSVLLMSINAARFSEAVTLRTKFKDKPDISFTDLTSMVTMRELELRRIMTEDHHFVQVGMGFELVP